MAEETKKPTRSAKDIQDPFAKPTQGAKEVAVEQNPFDQFDQDGTRTGENLTRRQTATDAVQVPSTLKLSDLMKGIEQIPPVTGLPLVAHALLLAAVGATLSLLAATIARKLVDARVLHGVALALALAVCFTHLYSFPLAWGASAIASAILANLLLWSYKRATRAPTNGWTRIYAVVIGLAAASAVASGDADGMLFGASFIWLVTVARFLFFWIVRGFSLQKQAAKDA